MRGTLHVVRTTPRAALGAFTRDQWQVLASHAVVVQHGSTAIDELRRQGVDVRACSEANDAETLDHLVAFLSTTCEPTGSVVWLREDRPERMTDTDALDRVAELWTAAGGDVLEHASPLEPNGAHLLDLVRVMDVLRSPGGCPWDARQTHESLLRYLIEEAYEVVDAVQGGDDEHLREELGDLMLQVVFHSRIAQERDREPWSIDDVADGIVSKLVRRHPHVFSRATVGDEPINAEDVEAGWKQLKAAEKQRTGVLDGVPQAQPALLLASALVSRAEAHAVVPAALASGSTDAAEWGDHLLALAAGASELGIDPEAALRAAVRRAAERIDSSTSDEGGAESS